MSLWPNAICTFMATFAIGKETILRAFSLSLKTLDEILLSRKTGNMFCPCLGRIDINQNTTGVEPA